MAKKYQMKDDVMPKGKDYLGLDWAEWASLKNGKIVELDKVPKKAFPYISYIKCLSNPILHYEEISNITLHII